MTDQAQSPVTSTPSEAPTTTDAVTPSGGEPIQDNSTSEPASFLSQLPDDFEGAEGLSKFEKGGVPALAKSYLELESKMRSGDKLAMPKGSLDEDPEGWQPIIDRMGRPKDAGEYSFADAESTDPLLSPYTNTAHGLGLTEKQAAGVYEWFKGETANLAENARKAGEATMREKWGTEFQSRVMRADEFLSDNLSQGVRDVMKASGLAHNPEFIQLVYNAAVRAGEDVAFNGEQPHVPSMKDNPYDRSSPSFNLSRQSQLERDDPATAQRYRQEIGYTGH